MPNSTKLFQSKEKIIGKHLKSNEWIMYIGLLMIYDRTSKPVILKIKSEIYDSFLSTEMDDMKEFKGDTISEVYQKLSSWFRRKGVIF